MDFAASVLLLFPAFLIGAAFGILIVLVLAGGAGLKDKRPLVFSAIGSLAGIPVFLLTANLWPPIVGPFVLCPVLALTAALASRR